MIAWIGLRDAACVWVRRALFVLFSPLLLAQGRYTRAVTPRLPEPSGARSGQAGNGRGLRLLIAGDSAAAGVGIEHQQAALSGQLVAALTPHFDLCWQRIAQTGYTTRHLQARPRAITDIRRGYSLAGRQRPALAGCGGGDSGGGATATAAALNAAPPPNSVNPQVIPHNAVYRGKTYSQWEASLWQWALALHLGPLPHPFADCTRPISAGQTGNVWYWSAPDIPNELCDQSATIIPAGTSIFLSTLDDEASSLDAPPFNDPTAAGQLAIAQQFADYIQDLFVTIDGVPLADVTAYRTTTAQFTFNAPTPWIFLTRPAAAARALVTAISLCSSRSPVVPIRFTMVAGSILRRACSVPRWTSSRTRR